MEQRLWRETQEHINSIATATATAATTTTAATTAKPESPSLKPLSTIHSLITNPSTSHLTLSSIFQTLTHFLSHHPPNHPFHHPTFSLLSTLFLLHPSFSLPPPLSTSFLSDAAASPRLAAAAAALSLSSAESLDENLVISLCFRDCVSVRVWFLRNALRLSIRPNLLLTVMLGFTKDPFPCVRKAALDGLVGVCDSGVVVEDCQIVECCYFRAIELMTDHEDYVRLAAIRVVCQWGCMLAATKQEQDKCDCYDGVFLQICSMVRDMNVGVRAEAFTALGKIASVSQDILLQTLSKRVLGTIKDKQSLALSGSKLHKIHAAVAAGAFIHGLEDEYHEEVVLQALTLCMATLKVQRAACISLRMLPVVSDQFAGEAVNILSYVLNDDSVTVRLEVLKTIHHMAKSGCLKMQEAHIDMLLGTLVDSSSEIRSGALNILKSVKFPDTKVAKSTVESLLRSLDIYPKNEVEIYRVLFNMGQNHAKYAVSILQDLYHEIEPGDDRGFGYNSSRIGGLIVLAISASLKHEKYFRQISPRIYSYAAAYFGRISLALDDVLDIDSLLVYLSYCGRCLSEVNSETMARPEVLPAAKGQQEAPVHVLNTVKLILATVKKLWPLVQCGCTDEVLKALRCCKGSLVIARAGSSAYAGAVAFAYQYVRLVKLLTKIWGHFVVSRTQLYQIGELDLLLEKLNKVILALRYTFIGLHEDVELFMLEILLLKYVLQLSSSHTLCKTLQKLSIMVANVGQLRNTKSIICSDFVNQLGELYTNGSFSVDSTCDPIQLKKLQDLFMLKDLILTQGIRQIHAELVVLGFDSLNPLRFIPGLPVSIPLNVTLHNVTSGHRLWLKFTMGYEITEFVFIDMEEYGCIEETREFKLTVPFYKTPKAVAFSLRVSMGMECMTEDLHLVKGYGGPKHALTYISPDIEVNFVHMNADHIL